MQTSSISAAGVLLLAAAVHGQIINPGRGFFNRGGVALYQPQIDVVPSGVQMVARPTVSSDRKYVTIGGQFQSSQLLKLETFPVASFPVFGFVGGAAPPPQVTSNAEAINASTPVHVRIGSGGALLRQTGMIRIE